MDKSPKSIINKIESVVTSKIEEMMFVEVNVARDNMQKPKLDEPITAVIHLREPFEGRFTISVGRELAISLATSLFNSENKKIDNEIVDDLTREILNILAGAVMASLLKAKANFKLGIPIISRGERPSASDSFFHFEIDGYPFLFETPKPELFMREL